MSEETKSKDSRDRTKASAPEDGAADNDQRRFRGQRTPADGKRDDVLGEETAQDAPTDPEDDAFLKSK